MKIENILVTLEQKRGGTMSRAKIFMDDGIFDHPALHQYLVEELSVYNVEYVDACLNRIDMSGGYGSLRNEGFNVESDVMPIVAYISPEFENGKFYFDVEVSEI